MALTYRQNHFVLILWANEIWISKYFKFLRKKCLNQDFWIYGGTSINLTHDVKLPENCYVKFGSNILKIKWVVAIFIKKCLCMVKVIKWWDLEVGCGPLVHVNETSQNSTCMCQMIERGTSLPLIVAWMWLF